MNSRITAALLLAGTLLVAGLAGQAAFAHNFTDDESATFLVKVDTIKVHMTLVGRNLGDTEAALAHVEHARMQLDNQTLAELGERNERLATDIPAAFDELSTMIEAGASKPQIAQKIRSISDLLAEAVSARIDAAKLSDPTVRALVVAGLVDNALSSYEAAHMEGGMVMDDNGSMGTGSMSAQIMDKDSYIASKLFTFRAKNLFHMIAGSAQSQEDATAAWNGLVNIRDAINMMSSWEDVTVMVHANVHENLGKAFGLELEGHTGSDSMQGDHMG